VLLLDVGRAQVLGPTPDKITLHVILAVLGRLEVAFHGTKRVHSVGALYSFVAAEEVFEETGCQTCPKCRANLVFLPGRQKSRICRQRACPLLENSGRAEKLETGSPSPVETSANVNVMLGNQNLETESLSGKLFPCPVCGIALDIRNSRKQEPCCVCNSCRIQLFFRGKTGIGRLHFSTNVCRAFCCDE